MQATRWSVVALLLVPICARAQAPRYDAATVGCARFAESVRGAVQTAYGQARATDSVGREGVLEVRARTDSLGLEVEAWYDSLVVFRRSAEGRDAPGTGGILGGRYRGILDPDGTYTMVAAPFVPAALRDVFDFARLLAHFFPPLARGALAPGAEWSDGAGLTIWREVDSTAGAGPIQRYRWTRREAWEEGVSLGDSTVVVRREDSERGALAWGSGEGPLAWSSSVTSKAVLPQGAGQSEVVQEVRVRRLSARCEAP